MKNSYVIWSFLVPFLGWGIKDVKKRMNKKTKIALDF